MVPECSPPEFKRIKIHVPTSKKKYKVNYFHCMSHSLIPAAYQTVILDNIEPSSYQLLTAQEDLSGW